MFIIKRTDNARSLEINGPCLNWYTLANLTEGLLCIASSVAQGHSLVAPAFVHGFKMLRVGEAIANKP